MAGPDQRRSAQSRGHLGVITGSQIRAARALLGWDKSVLVYKAKVGLSALIRAEGSDGEPAITMAQGTALQQALEAGGVEFTTGGQPGVRLRNGPEDGRRK